MIKGLALYGVVMGICGLGIFFILNRGRNLAPPPTTARTEAIGSLPTTPKPVAGIDQPVEALSYLKTTLHEPLSLLLLQLVVILTMSRVTGSLFARLGQPSVIGEMFAGVFLGPSLFGWLFPGAYKFIFPDTSFAALRLLSQIGVCLFMFVVGMELNVNHLRAKAYTAVLVSHASIVFPYSLGVLVSLALFSELAGPGVSFLSFALFMGISMSITAFPVLARILRERRLDQTPLGTTAIACAAVDDVTAWSLLACVVAIVRSTGLPSTFTRLALVVLFILVMVYGLRPRLPRWFGADHPANGTSPSKGIIAGILVFTFLSALTTEVMGIHALFGSFLAGVVMPVRSEFRDYLKIRLENFSSVFLLPLFFAFNGLRTQIGLISGAESWWLCLLIIATATFGKLGGSMFTARLTGMTWLDSFSLGALLNTRGLMELIAINMGYDLGILSPRIFAMLVLMALTTTFMTSPLLALVQQWRDKPARSQ